MRWCRTFVSGKPYWAQGVDGGWEVMSDAPWSDPHPIGLTLSEAKVQLLPPATPSKIVCVGINYEGHLREVNRERPAEPVIFLKPPSSLTAADSPVIYPAEVTHMALEGELAVVMGRRGKSVPAVQAADYIFGYTIANDISARDLQKRDGQWTRGKSFDTFLPLGPWIETAVNPQELRITTTVDGQVRQDEPTSGMVFGVADLVAFISRIMTLEAGDLILTGTPGGASQLQPGQQVTVAISGIGSLTNLIQPESDE